jgi:hypothetical protein
MAYLAIYRLRTGIHFRPTIIDKVHQALSHLDQIGCDIAILTPAFSGLRTTSIRQLSGGFLG